ncbi:dihydroneopterin aldolase [Amylibacter sp. IMCC11727]|uniref:dihydroneopterin aldolase n=1 Tax=Amylibacter sp. IMCC11727 TaxID=3039851 RepID=UPI00244DAC0D|nr:dihydroneopterin aldolase [Amylibacter sp. IMCC11727]WGI20858.1 dihydroneopterin aldolase [Amylibacter sp. IMCC11727]
MTDETALAFDTLEARSIASAIGQPLDRIAVRDYSKSVEIGAFQAERGVTQGLRFNVVLEVARHDGAQTDDVDAVLSYDTITEAIEAELAAERLNLLETLAERVATRILQHKLAERVFVRIEKTERGPGSLGVEIVRVREDAGSVDAGVQVRPVVVFLPDAIVRGDALGAWLDQITAMDAPVVLCVEPNAAVDLTGKAEPDQRLQLLAIEQAAWVLAARDARCVVVGTRTELDWALKNGQMSVWAPSRIAMDAVEQPAGDDAVGLAVWFGAEFNAARVLACGDIKDDRLDVALDPSAL